MAGGDSKKGTYGLNPNFEWPPERYYNMAAYVLMFNGIVNSHDDYYIENSNGDQFINAFIEKHLEELVEKEDNIYAFIKLPQDMPRRPIKPERQSWHSDEQYAALLKQSGYQEKYDKYRADYKAWEEGKVYDKDSKTWVVAANSETIRKKREKELADYKKEIAKFKSDLPNYIAKAKEFSKKTNSTNEGYLSKMLTNEQMADVLKEKEDAVRRWHEDVRKASTSKSGQVDSDGKANHYHDWDNVQAELRNKNRIVRRNGWRSFRRFAATALFGAVTLASVSALLAYGGFALTAMFGTAFNATGVSGAVLGFVGTVGGGAFTKRFFGRFLDSLNEGRKLRRDRREFIKGFGKYSDKYEMGSSKQKQARGYRSVQQRFYENIAIQKYLEKGVSRSDYESMGFFQKLNYRRTLGLTGENAYLRKYLRRGLRRNGIFNPFSDAGQPVNLEQLRKETGYYKFVTDKYDSKKDNKGFKKMYALLGAAKSFNANDVHSVQAHTIITEDFLRGAEKGEYTLEEVRLKLDELKRGESKFEGDNQDKYQELMHRFSEVVINTMDRELFENAYDSDLVGTREDMYKIPSIKERYEQTKQGDCTEHAENAFEFIENLRKDTFAGGVLTDRVEASINDQVHIDKKHMENACSRYKVPQEIVDPSNPDAKIPNPVYTAMQTACAQIGSISSKGSASDAAFTAVNRAIEIIETTVPVEECNTKAATYLKYMRDKKLAETTHNAASLTQAINDRGYTVIPAGIQTSIAGINHKTTPQEIAKIKETIITDATLSLPANADAKTFALELIDSQIEAVERKKRNDAIVGALPSIRENKLHKYKEFFEMIPKSGEEIDPVKMEGVLDKFKKIQPEEMSKFLIFRLKDKITSNLKHEATGAKFDVSGGKYETAIDALRGYIRTIGVCTQKGIMDEWQKNACSKAIESKVLSAFKPYLEDLEKAFLVPDTNAREIARRYLQPMQNQGFAEFLDSGTPEATELKDRITRIFEATDLYSLMSANSRGGAFGELVCPNDEETRSTLRTYFMRDRDDTDPLKDVLKTMRTATTETKGFSGSEELEMITATSATSTSIFDGTTLITTTGYKSQSFVQKMYDIIGKLSVKGVGGKTTNAYDGTAISAEDALAMLLVMKKRTLAMVKAQMNRLYMKKRSGTEPVDTFARNNADAVERLKNAWMGLADKIDERLEELQSQVKTEFKGYKSCRGVIEAGATASTYDKFMTTSEM